MPGSSRVQPGSACSPGAVEPQAERGGDTSQPGKPVPGETEAGAGGGSPRTSSWVRATSKVPPASNPQLRAQRWPTRLMSTQGRFRGQNALFLHVTETEPREMEAEDPRPSQISNCPLIPHKEVSNYTYSPPS